VEEILSGHDGDILLHRDVFTPIECSVIFDVLNAESPWRQEHLTLFGRRVLTPRLSSWHGEAVYTYSGLTMEPAPWTPTLVKIKDRAENISTARFNSVLLNLYRHGRDSMSWHSDDEPELGKNPVIASISLGATRRFRLRHKQDKSRTLGLDLENGSLLLMSGTTQHHWQHAVPKTAKPVGPRINLTFRWTHPT